MCPQEATILFQLAHPNVLAVGGIVDEPGICSINIYEPTTGNLSQHLMSTPDTPASSLRDYAIQIARGLSYATGAGVFHWDVAARNILLSSDRQCKLANFGLNKAFDDRTPNGFYTNPQQQVVMRWSPPEVVGTEAAQHGNNAAEDVWAFGWCLYELYTGGECAPVLRGTVLRGPSARCHVVADAPA